MPPCFVFCFWEGGKPLFGNGNTCLAELSESYLGASHCVLMVAIDEFGFSTYNI